MGGFDFATAGRVHFGAGRAAELPGLVAPLGARVLVVTGAHPERHRDVLDALAPVAVHPLAAEPTLDVVREATALARAERADVVVGLGGGSVVDLGKAVAMLLGNGGDPLDYLEVVGRGRPIQHPPVPYVAVPTTAGTGAEVTENAVVTVPERGRKASLRSPHMLPRLAVVDPVLTLGCPPAVTASSGLDALTQCLEPLVSPYATPLTDALAADGLARAARSLRAAHATGRDLDARTDMALASLLGGMSLANAKLGAVHGFAGVIGGMSAAAHGALCAALLVPVWEGNLRGLRARSPASPALDRYAAAARLLVGSPDATVADGSAWLRDTVAALGIRGLASLGVPQDRSEEIVASTATASSTKGNPVLLTVAELHGVLDQAW